MNLFKTLLSIAIILFSSLLFGQKQLNLKELKFAKNDENIQVIPLASDTNSSSFYIQVAQQVKAHVHKNHTETIYVVQGEANMILGSDTLQIKEGDFIEIPQNTVHSVRVTSLIDLKVLSTQSPKFIGVDRHFVE